MSELYMGMLWLMRPSVKITMELERAAEYVEEKYGRPVRLIACPVDENYPNSFHGIPIRPDRRIMAHHVYLVMARADGVTPLDV